MILTCIYKNMRVVPIGKAYKQKTIFLPNLYICRTKGVELRVDKEINTSKKYVTVG